MDYIDLSELLGNSFWCALSKPRLDASIATNSIILAVRYSSVIFIIDQLSMCLDDEFPLVDVVQRDLKL
jgi:hypothetical protein